MFDYRDTLDALNENAPLAEKLRLVHDVLRRRYRCVDRIAIALYDRSTDSLKTFINSGDAQPLVHYEARLADAPQLQEIVKLGRPRVVPDLDLFAPGTHEHTERIAAEGYASSYTMPLYHNGLFFALLFYNSRQRDPFDRELLHYLDVFGHLISLVISSELSAFKNLLATVKTARDVAHLRDNETGAHLDRMSRYARLIATRLADKHGFTDEFIERVFILSPLHDIGKIGIPDEVLLKKGKLTGDELTVMRTHPLKGREIVDAMLDNFELDSMPEAEILRNIAAYHHESIDGTGYPYGLAGEGIPIEARIVAVADVFDALTSQRPYKPAWSNEEAFAMLQRIAGAKLDPECVSALIASRDEIEAIQRRFEEDPFG